MSYHLDTIGDLYGHQPPQMAGVLDDFAGLIGISSDTNAAPLTERARQAAQDAASVPAQTAANLAKKGAEMAAIEAKKAAAYAISQARSEAARVRKTAIVVGAVVLLAGGAGLYYLHRKQKRSA
jgi:hypothetical protein